MHFNFFWHTISLPLSIIDKTVKINFQIMVGDKNIVNKIQNKLIYYFFIRIFYNRRNIKNNLMQKVM